MLKIRRVQITASIDKENPSELLCDLCGATHATPGGRFAELTFEKDGDRFGPILMCRGCCSAIDAASDENPQRAFRTVEVEAG